MEENIHQDLRNGRIAPAVDKFGLELLVNVRQVNDKDGAVGRLVGAVDVVAVEDSHAVGSEVRPELLEVLPDDVLSVARVVERDFLAHAADEAGVVLARLGRGAVRPGRRRRLWRVRTLHGRRRRRHHLHPLMVLLLLLILVLLLLHLLLLQHLGRETLFSSVN